MRDLYSVLGISRDASPQEIKKAYRRLAHRYHPDKNPDSARAEERFREATEAYEILSNREKRERYDMLDNGKRPGSGEAPVRPDAPEAPRQNRVGDVFSDIFGDFFRRKEKIPKRGKDKKYTLRIQFKTAIQGGERVIDIPRVRVCTGCDGRGFPPDAVPQLCHACGGSGSISVQQGLFSVKKACGFCKGKGKVITTPCQVCDGSGITEKITQIKVKIPPGADNGTVLRYPGEGEPSEEGGPPGDLRVVISVREHPLFTRSGETILVEVPITPANAILGTQIDVPSLDGKVKVKVPPGTQSGRIFSFKGRGAPKLPDGGRGDLQVRIVVETPVELTKEQRQLYKELAELDRDSHYPMRRKYRRKRES